MSTTPFVLAASAEMLFVDRPVADRVRAIHDAGLRRRDLGLAQPRPRRARGARRERRRLHVDDRLHDRHPRRRGRRRRAAAHRRRVGRRSRAGSGTPSLNLHGTGLDNRGLPVVPGRRGHTPQMWDTARRTLARIAELGEREGVTFVLENLNTAVDHPRTPFARAADTLDLVRGVDSPHLRLNLDLYHAQIGEGNLIELCREALPWVAEVQVADVPGRCEPGTGEIRYAGVARALADAGFTGVVGSRGLRERRPGCRAGRLPRGLHPGQWLSVRCSCTPSSRAPSTSAARPPRRAPGGRGRPGVAGDMPSTGWSRSRLVGNA